MNKLEKEKSLYLQQHANNPVDCYLGEMRLKYLDLVISQFSYQLATLHVTGVMMAHESFEDEDIAEIMNKNFVNIKLDREERPDLDKIYQTAQTIITGKTEDGL